MSTAFGFSISIQCTTIVKRKINMNIQTTNNLSRLTNVRFKPVLILSVFFISLMSIQYTIADSQTVLESGVIPYGKFQGISYVKYTGHFISTTDDYSYKAAFELIVPEDPDKGENRVILEPYHSIEGSVALENMLTTEFVFGKGFRYAAICWRPPNDNFVNLSFSGMTEHPCADFEGDEGIEIRVVADFANAIKQGDFDNIIGEVEHLYSIGVSNSRRPLQPLLLDPLGDDLFDLSILVTGSWTFGNAIPSTNVGKIIMLNAEADTIINEKVYPDASDPTQYRFYDMAGAGHIPPELTGIPGLAWTPIARAVFVAGDQWITDGVDPPETHLIENSTAGEIDPVYNKPTGIARDVNGNALGGIRLPDLTLGRRQFIASNEDLVFGLIGEYIDLECEPLQDGSPRFTNHGRYVYQFIDAVDKLIADRFILRSDGLDMINAAVLTDVGKPDSCSR